MSDLVEQENEWEFDDRRWDICKDHLQNGEELVWYEKDSRFAGHHGQFGVRKTLRRRSDAITFLVESMTEIVHPGGYPKVLTVGTISLI